MACYQQSGTQMCCNFYDINDNCLTVCGTNQEPNSDYTCVCSGFFEPQGDCNGKKRKRERERESEQRELSLGYVVKSVLVLWPTKNFFYQNFILCSLSSFNPNHSNAVVSHKGIIPQTHTPGISLIKISSSLEYCLLVTV